MKAVLSLLVALLFVVWATSGAAVDDPRVEERIRIKREEQFCVPNSTFQMDCNECICEPNGLSASCTGEDCAPDRRRRDVSCRPGTTFKENCTTCFCGEDGKSTICAPIGCSGGKG